jgi:tRNA(fMet)-specific endonuclease VapC
VETVDRVLVDADVLVDYLRGRRPGLDMYVKWQKLKRLALTSIVAFELLLGARLSSKQDQRIAEVRSLLDQHQVFSFDTKAADFASKVGGDLRKKGRSLEIRDLLNASICLAQDLPLLTKNKAHYDRIAGLKIFSE